MSNLVLTATLADEVPANIAKIPVAPLNVGLPSSADFAEGAQMEWNGDVYEIMGAAWTKKVAIPAAQERAALGWKEHPSGVGYITNTGAFVPWKPYEEMNEAEKLAFDIGTGSLPPEQSAALNPPTKVPIFAGGQIIGYKENPAGPTQTGLAAIAILQQAATAPLTQKVAQTPAPSIQAPQAPLVALAPTVVTTMAAPSSAPSSAPAAASQTIGAAGTWAPQTTPATTADVLALPRNKWLLVAGVVALVFLMRR